MDGARERRRRSARKRVETRTGLRKGDGGDEDAATLEFHLGGTHAPGRAAGT